MAVRPPRLADADFHRGSRPERIKVRVTPGYRDDCEDRNGE
jgi:hypothetical protein